MGPAIQGDMSWASMRPVQIGAWCRCTPFCLATAHGASLWILYGQDISGIKRDEAERGRIDENGVGIFLFPSGCSSQPRR